MSFRHYRFHIPSRPVPQGSKRHVGNGRMIEQSNVKDWRALAVATMRDRTCQPITEGVWVSATWAFPRPASHYGTGRNAGVLKDSAPLLHLHAPDTDKLQRALGDALAASAVISDDRLIFRWLAQRVWAGSDYPAGTHVTVWEVANG